MSFAPSSLRHELLRQGAVTKFFRREVFDGAVTKLTEAEYRVHAIDSSSAGLLREQMTSYLLGAHAARAEADRRTAAAQSISADEAKSALLAEKQPSLDFVTTEQLGELVVFLCSPAADQVRGVAWAMDGGWTAQ